jgi:polar amino acid transport system permease protein
MPVQTSTANDMHQTSLELRRRRPQRTAAQGAAIAVVSTVAVLLLGYFLITRSSGWPKVHKSFFNGKRFAESLPEIWSKFGENVKIFLVCELAILTLGLLLAVLRTSKSPALFPFRAFSVLFTDVMRGIPLTLLIFLFGFGIPGLGLDRPWNNATIWGALAMVLVYSAYVSEVFRAGIESIHPSQMAAARGLGLSRPQGLRYIVVPQAVRRVVPPLLNDFIGLQKDTAQLQALGLIEAVRAAQMQVSKGFNFTPYFGVAMLFLIITIPQTRFVDWMQVRERNRQR